MKPSANKTRKIEIVFPGEITDQEKNTIRGKILLIDPLLEMKLDNQMIKVDYTLSTVRLSLIWQIVSKAIHSKSFSFSKKLMYSLKAYIEDNEYDHMRLPCGWDDYSQSIFFYYYNRQVGRRRNKKLMWQKYIQGKNTKSKLLPRHE